jgi:hypothetical protein
MSKIVDQTRRSAIKTAAQVAVTAPAVGLLLTGSAKAGRVNVHYGDDFHGTVIQPTSGDDNASDSRPFSATGNLGDDFFTF